MPELNWGDATKFPQMPEVKAHKYYTVLPGDKFELDIAGLKRDVRLFMGSIIYGMTPPDFTLAIVQTIQLLHKMGLPHKWSVQKGNSDAALARNIMAADFLSGNCTHLMFLDSDHWWYNDDILRMLAMDKPVLGMCYAKKQRDWAEYDNVGQDIWDHKVKPKDVVWEEVGLVCSGVLSEGAKEEDGIALADRLPAGGMLIKREVFERIIQKRPDLKWTCGDGVPEHLQPYMHSFFQPGFARDKSQHFGEDYAFSNLCRDLGFKIYGDMMAKVCHWGLESFTKNPRSLLEK
jgi:hypothetical protein